MSLLGITPSIRSGTTFMTRRKYSKKRSQVTRRGAALQLLLLGFALALLPYFVGKAPLANALRPAALMGWLLILVGAGMLWISRQKTSARILADREAPSGFVQTPRFRGLDDQRRSSEPFFVAGPTSDSSSSNANGPARPAQWSADVFSAIEWRRFEALIEAVFTQAGFTTTSQSHGADGGVDVWLHAADDPQTSVGIVQCKHWSGKSVGVKEVRELRGVMASHAIARGHFATTSAFTADARTFALANGIHLLDANGLLTLIAKRTAAEQQALLNVALEGEYWRQTCASCGAKMTARSSQKNGSAFWNVRPIRAAETGCRCENKVSRRDGRATAALPQFAAAQRNPKAWGNHVHKCYPYPTIHDFIG